MKKEIIEHQEQQVSNVSLMMNVDVMDRVIAVADFMSNSTVTVPEHLRGKPSDCLAVVMQAAQWGMNPYAVAQKTHLVNGTLGYEAQLVNAVVTSSNAVKGRFHYEYGGDWSRCTGTKEVTREKMGRNGSYKVQERVRAWDDKDEHGLFIRVGAILRGESEITWGEQLYLSGVITRNSPLWVSNPKQQIAYLAVKYWARLYCPEVILGVYSPEEFESEEVRAPKDITSQSEVSDRADMAKSDKSETEKSILDDDRIASIRESIGLATTTNAAVDIRKEIESLKSSMSIDAYTELKNKAVKRYYSIEAAGKVQVAINNLSPDLADAAEEFARVEELLRRSERNITPDDMESFQIMLDDMRPEYMN
ncbi:recombinase RecT [Jinshanibacter sp. LJY008]|uniref:Recombinase RecT n=1 Tax=Limnobaculum eriocheiris TaxID=2897391 RepID=A0A9X1SJR1_9GAMM|nr:RecT family recombinase [Limnobaculum eriocheiris]MCD1124850.1 recombinase RecT [Limnobaculum eriocheiris]